MKDILKGKDNYLYVYSKKEETNKEFEMDISLNFGMEEYIVECSIENKEEISAYIKFFNSEGVRFFKEKTWMNKKANVLDKLVFSHTGFLLKSFLEVVKEDENKKIKINICL